MTFAQRFLSSATPLLLLACACVPSISAAEFLRVADGRRYDLRAAVAAHRAAQRDEMRRGEAIAGRRLTPAELYELRQQVRGQWSTPGISAHSAESQPAERIVPAPMPAARLLPAPRSQRP
mgnify:FL=1|jgi:hypothetical protein